MYIKSSGVSLSMEEKIIAFINNNIQYYSLEELKKYLQLNSISNHELRQILQRLEQTGEIFYNKEQQTYCSLLDKYKVVDILATTKGYKYFLDSNNNKIYIDDDKLNGALAFSKVVVEKRNNKYHVVKVLEHKNDKIVCEVQIKEDIKLLAPMNLPAHYKVRISNKDMKKLADGDRILVRIGTDIEDNCFEGELVKILCHRNEPNKELLSIAYSRDFEFEFSPKALEEIENIPDTVLESELEGRLDLRDEITFTIDGIHTKDMDDAISLKLLENGNYELGVHIADVSHYVKPGMHLYEDARNRATSLYMVDSVIPMLPPKLSNGICSLNPGVDRLTKSCIMEIDKNGNVVDSKIVDSVIHSHKRMDYDSVNYILENGIIPDGYEPYYGILKQMQKLANTFNNIKSNKGKIDFVSHEIEVVTNEEGKPTKFELAHHGEAEKIIENFMVIANETVASYFSSVPFVYRVHEMPNELKLDSTVKFITSLGYRVNTCGNANSPKLIQNILKSLSNEQEYPLLSDLLLRSMKKAEYATENIGHFGLALDYYTHFTSPIRRFPDLQVHSLINLYQKADKKIDFKILEKVLNEVCIHSSYKERQADAAERDSKDLMMAEYMTNHIGEEFPGIVINNETTNMRVRTDDLIYGKVQIPDYQNINNYKYKLGSPVLLKVENVSLIDRSIYFSIVKRLEPKEKDKQLVKKKEAK